MWERRIVRTCQGWEESILWNGALLRPSELYEVGKYLWPIQTWPHDNRNAGKPVLMELKLAGAARSAGT